jgi:hypothetical protein
MRTAFKRAFGSVSEYPWKFRASAPDIPIKELDPRFRDLFHKKLSDGFAYAFQSLCDSLGNHDMKSLEDCLEGRLFDLVKSRLSEMERSRLHFHLIGEQNPSLRLYNMTIHLGVHIERKDNLPKNKYLRIDSLENMKKSYASGNKPPRIMEENLEHIWLYVHPDAPANLIVALDVLYQGPNPLTILTAEGQDLFSGRQVELHHLRFESCAVALGLQVDAAKKQGLTQLLGPIRSNTEELISSAWEVVDIDNIMKGNPFLV